ncbi:MAG: YqcI/YcgG family protein [Bacillaceae bacterium]|nr:YqcI/YcgG family protein [Bacillaceae bacterium]
MNFLTTKEKAQLQLHGWKLNAIQHFEEKMTNRQHLFPCIPATQAFALSHLRYGFVGHPDDDLTSYELAQVLKEYSENYRQFGKYTTLIVFFKGSHEENITVEEYEQKYWKLLNKVTELDEKSWPEHIPQDPHENEWEFCFHGEPYFMYCATPVHTHRNSRSFPYFMMAITPRWVLQQFNTSPDYAEKMKTQIRKRLAAYDHIEAHPELKKYGEDDNYEWKQYFLHDDETALSKCPFHRAQQLLMNKKN